MEQLTLEVPAVACTSRGRARGSIASSATGMAKADGPAASDEAELWWICESRVIFIATLLHCHLEHIRQLCQSWLAVCLHTFLLFLQ